jgi:putative oxidoreductase
VYIGTMQGVLDRRFQGENAVKTALIWALRLGLGLMFVVAGALKLDDPTSFALEIHNYQLLPALAPWLAATLPAIEIILGLTLMAAPRPWARASALASTLVLVMFTVAVGSAVVRGVNITCGCFGEGSGPVTIWTILRDVGFVAAAGALFWLLTQAEQRGSGAQSAESPQRA